MLAKADAREAALIAFFLGTGCRTGFQPRLANSSTACW